jgi:hypothetical protein
MALTFKPSKGRIDVAKKRTTARAKSARIARSEMKFDKKAVPRILGESFPGERSVTSTDRLVKKPLVSKRAVPKGSKFTSEGVLQENFNQRGGSKFTTRSQRRPREKFLGIEAAQKRTALKKATAQTARKQKFGKGVKALGRTAPVLGAAVMASDALKFIKKEASKKKTSNKKKKK